MMLKPYMNELLKKIPNRYELVNVTAKRARDIAEECQEQGIELTEKPVTLALEEIDQGKIVAKHGVANAEHECECCCGEACENAGTAEQSEDTEPDNSAESAVSEEEQE